MYKEECIYNPEADGRRSTPKAYVSALEERVRVLERTLRSHGLDTGAAAGAGAGEVKIEREESSPVDAGLDRLKVGEIRGLTNGVSWTKLLESYSSTGRLLYSMAQKIHRHHMRRLEAVELTSGRRCCGHGRSFCRN